MNLKKIVIVSVVAAAIAAAPVFATCPDPAPTFGQLFQSAPWCSSEPTGFCAVISPGSNIQARFWSLTQGNFAVDNTVPSCATATCGADNGSWSPFDATLPWVIQADEGSGPVPGKYWIGGDWNASGNTDTNMKIDGCPNFATPPAMLIGLSDSDANGNGYWALAWARYSPGAKGDFEFSTIDKTSAPNDQGTGAGNIILRPVPRPNVTASARIDTDTRSFTIGIPTAGALSNALYGDNTLTESQVANAVRIYQRIVPRGAPVSSVGNDRPQWTAATAPITLGSPDTTVSVDCATDSDVYFSYSLVGDSGFEFAKLGTVRAGQCGPNLAAPGPGKGKGPKNIERP